MLYYTPIKSVLCILARKGEVDLKDLIWDITGRGGRGNLRLQVLQMTGSSCGDLIFLIVIYTEYRIQSTDRVEDARYVLSILLYQIHIDLSIYIYTRSIQ